MIDIADENKKAIYTLARKIIETDTIGSSAVSISMSASSTSKDKLILKHHEETVKRELMKIKDKLHKIEEYVEELEAHIYDGEIDG